MEDFTLHQAEYPPVHEIKECKLQIPLESNSQTPLINGKLHKITSSSISGFLFMKQNNESCHQCTSVLHSHWTMRAVGFLPVIG